MSSSRTRQAAAQRRALWLTRTPLPLVAVRAGDLTAAERALLDMCRAGHRPNVVSWNALLHGVAQLWAWKASAETRQARCGQ